MYCVVMMDSTFGELKKCGKPLPYGAGSIFTLVPGQSVSLSVDYTCKRRGWVLAFRPELLVKCG